MRSSEEAAGGGRATVCAAAGRHQHATHVPVTSSVSKIWSFERTAYATPGGWEPPDKGTMPHGSAANWSGGYRARRRRVKAAQPAGLS